MRGARRLAGFVMLPALNALAPLLVLPIITGHLGVDAWVGVAIAQSVGAGGAVLVELGWGLTGTQRVARQQRDNRLHLIALSTITKIIVFVPAALGSAVVVTALAPQDTAACVVIAIAGCITSFCPTWVYIGLGRASLILLFDTVPRTLGLLVAAGAVIATGSLWGFALPVLISSIVSASAGHIALGIRSRHFRAHPRRRILVAMRAQGSALTGRALSALYIALPVTLVGAVATVSEVAVFSAVERLQRMLLTGLQALPNAIQGWVGSAGDPQERRKRALTAVWANGGTGIVAGAVAALILPPASRILFSGVADIPAELAALSGLLIAIVSFSRATGGIALVTVGRIDAIAWSALAGAVVGIPAILLLAGAFGAAGGLLGEISAELVVLSVQSVALARALRQRKP